MAVEEPRPRVVRLQQMNSFGQFFIILVLKWKSRTLKRIVTLSPASPMLTTSRRGGFT